METHIDHIKTPVHGIVELEFSVFRLLLKNEEGQIVFCQTFNQTFSSGFLNKLSLLSLEVLVWPKCFSLVPSQFVDGGGEALLSLTNQGVDKLLVKEEVNQSIGQTAVYAIDPDQQLQCLNAYSGAIIKNAVSPLINLSMTNMIQDLVQCHIEKKRLWIIAKKKGKLSLCNVYNVFNEEEVLYYVSAVVDQFFDTKVQVFLSGHVSEKQADLLKQYLYKVDSLTLKTETSIDTTAYYQFLL